MKRILIVEDEPVFRQGLEARLSLDFEVTSASRGDTAVTMVKRDRPDLVLLDIRLEDALDGFDVLRQIRNTGLTMPVIMVSAVTAEIDRVVALELGADDYITKPFGERELLARIRACLRRLHRGETLSGCTFGAVHVDFERRRATRSGQVVQLTPKEFDLLRLLISRSNEVVSRDEILNQVWGMNYYPSMRTVDTHILTLRRKLEEDPGRPEYILSVHGEEYKFFKT